MWFAGACSIVVGIPVTTSSSLECFVSIAKYVTIKKVQPSCISTNPFTTCQELLLTPKKDFTNRSQSCNLDPAASFRTRGRKNRDIYRICQGLDCHHRVWVFPSTLPTLPTVQYLPATSLFTLDTTSHGRHCMHLHHSCSCFHRRISRVKRYNSLLDFSEKRYVVNEKKLMFRNLPCLMKSKTGTSDLIPVNSRHQ